MSDNTEPVVTQEDRDAAEQFNGWLGSHTGNYMSDAMEAELALRIAGNRSAAVAKREAEIVRMLKDLAMRHQKTALLAKKHEHWSTEDREWFAGQVLESIAEKIQNGGGA